MNSSVEKFKNWLENEKISFYKRACIEANKKYRLSLLSETEISERLLDRIEENSSEDVVEEFKSHGILTYLETLDYFLDLISEENDPLQNKLCLFADFKELSEMLLKTNLNNREKWNIIVYILEKDLRNYNKDSIFMDYEELEQLKMENMSQKEFAEFLYGEGFIEFCNKDYTELTEEEKIFCKKLLEKMRTSKTEKENSLVASLNAIKRHYIEKKESFKKEDVKIIIKALHMLDISSTLCASVECILEKECQKRLKEELIEKKPLIKEKQYDYSSLAKEVSEVVDLNDMRPKRILSLEEKIYYLSILTKMNVSKECRSLFLRNCDFARGEEHSVLKYLENYNRFKYYENSMGLQKEITFMESCFQDMMLCSNEEYLFWKDSLEEELKQVEHWIPKNFGYEEVEAQKLLRK